MNWTDIPIDITGLLLASESGDVVAREELYREVYTALLSIARQKVKALGNSGLWTAGGLLQETFLRLESRRFPTLKSRAELRAVMTRIMLSVLIDQYRHQQVVQRALNAEAEVTPAGSPQAEHLDLLHALSELQRLDRRQFEILMLRDCAELTHDEVAQTLDCSKSTVRREHAAARAWLRSRLQTPL